MDKTKEQIRQEWEAICRDEQTITVGFFDVNGSVVETDLINMEDIDALDRISSDVDLRSFPA